MAEGAGDSNVAMPHVKSESQPINIILRDQQGQEVHFKIKTSTKFEKVFKAYCDKKSLVLHTMRFICDGTQLAVDKTPADYDMDDGDIVDAMIEQVGGCSPTLQ